MKTTNHRQHQGVQDKICANRMKGTSTADHLPSFRALTHEKEKEVKTWIRL